MKSHLQLIPTTGMTREDWLAYRFSGLGASETGAVLGLDDYISSLELYYLKIGDRPRIDTESMAAFMGREQENLIANLWQYWDGSEEGMINNFRNGVVQRRARRINAFVRNPLYPWLFVSLDRIINKHVGYEERALELKTISHWEAQKWEAGLPPKYVIQVQTQLAVCEFAGGEMALLQDGRKFFVLPFDYNTTIVETIIAKTKEFWHRVQKGRELMAQKYAALAAYNYKLAEELSAEIDRHAPEPDGSLAYAKYLSERFNKPNKAERRGTAVEQTTAVFLQDLNKKIKELEEQRQYHENYLKAALADHQVLDFGADGKVYWSVDARGKRIFKNHIKI